jgi:hypothetical protein
MPELHEIWSRPLPPHDEERSNADRHNPPYQSESTQEHGDGGSAGADNVCCLARLPGSRLERGWGRGRSRRFRGLLGQSRVRRLFRSVSWDRRIIRGFGRRRNRGGFGRRGNRGGFGCRRQRRLLRCCFRGHPLDDTELSLLGLLRHAPLEQRHLSQAEDRHRRREPHPVLRTWHLANDRLRHARLRSVQRRSVSAVVESQPGRVRAPGRPARRGFFRNLQLWPERLLKRARCTRSPAAGPE